MFFMVFVKFICAGFLGVITNFTLTYIMKDIFKINRYLANSSALCMALFINFLLNRIWTFQVISDNIFLQFSKFSLVVFISVFLNHKIVYFFHNFFNWSFYSSKLTAVILLFFWNYIMHSLFTFRYLFLT